MANMNKWANTWGTVDLYSSEKSALQGVQSFIDAGVNLNMRDKEENTILILVAQRGYAKAVKALIKAGANVNLQNKDGNSALIWAAYHGDLNLVKQLMKAHADKDLQTKYNETALEIAARKGFKDVEEYLTHPEENSEENADEVVDENEIEPADDVVEETEEPEQEVQETPAEEPQQEQIDMPEAEMPEPEINEPEVAEPQKAVAKQKKGLFGGIKQAFMKHWFFSWRKIDWNKSTPEKMLQKAKDLVRAGADVNARDEDGLTPLMYFAELGNKDAVKFLIAHGANVNAKEEDGETALMHAAYYGYTDVADLLIKNKADVNDINVYGETALIIAVENGYSGFVERLLKQDDIELDVLDNSSSTALMAAAEKGYGKIAEMLIMNGADVNVKDEDGKMVVERLDLNKTSDRNMRQIIRTSIRKREELLERLKADAERKDLITFRKMMTEDQEKEALLLRDDRAAIRAKIAFLKKILQQSTPERREQVQKLMEIGRYYGHKDRQREGRRLKEVEKLKRKKTTER